MRERDYQAALIKTLKQMFPDCLIFKNDPSYLQGVPDLLILYNDQWAALEVKASYNSKEQPNQRYYIDLMKRMSYAAFICPENEEDVLRDLQFTFAFGRPARVS